MAILKSELQESLLTKSEQAAMRTLARVQQLNEGLLILQKMLTSNQETNGLNPTALATVKIYEFKDYLKKAIESTLLAHRLPANVPSQETKSQ
jgi:hypothetical protein